MKESARRGKCWHCQKAVPLYVRDGIEEGSHNPAHYFTQPHPAKGTVSCGGSGQAPQALVYTAEELRARGVRLRKR